MASPFVPPMEMPPIARPIRTSFAIKKKKRTMAGTPKVSVSEPKQSHMPLRDAALPMVSLAVACPPMSPGHAGPYDLEVFETGAVSLPMRKSFLNAGGGGGVMAKKRWARGQMLAVDLGKEHVKAKKRAHRTRLYP